MKFKFLLVSVLLTGIVSCSIDNQRNDNEAVSDLFLKKTASNWNENDFYQVRFYQLGNSASKTSVKPFQITEGLLIEEISKKKYESANQEKFRYYLKDTLALLKHNNQIRIGRTTLKDSSYTNGRFEFYSYLGYFPILNQYVIKGDYLDSLDYKMIDKNSGEIKQSFINYPIISRNGNFIAVCKTDLFDEQTHLEIFNFNNGFYKRVIKANFTNWRVVDFEEFSFWGSDGSLYLKIFKMSSDSKEYESFLKITLN